MANYNPNLVKINRSYTFEELGAVFGIHKNTVSVWVKKGLPCLNERRPFLILGVDARKYLQERRAAIKQQCQPNELFCMRCKVPTSPAGSHVDYVPLSATKGRLTGLCEACGCVVNKFVSYNSLEACAVFFDISIPKQLQHINDSDNPL